MRISYSALDTYTKCPQKYKFQEIQKIKGPKSKEAVFGTQIHAALNYMFSRDPLFPTAEEVIGHFRDSFSAVTTIPDEEKKRYLASGEKLLADFYAKNPPWMFRVIDLESRFEAVIEDPVYHTSHTLAGIIDRIDKPDDSTYEIIDYKTSRKIPSQESVDRNMQLAIYNIGLQKRWPHINPEDIKLSLHFVKSNEKLSTIYSATSLKKTEEKILSTLHTIEEKTKSDDFPPIPSALCDWCPYKPICPAWKHLYEQKTADPITKETSQEILKEYFALRDEIAHREHTLAELSKKITEYLDAHSYDRLFSPYGTITRSEQERTSWDGEKVKKLLSDRPEWPELIMPDPKKIKKALPSFPYELQEALKREALIIKKFKVMKASKKVENIQSHSDDFE